LKEHSAVKEELRNDSEPKINAQGFVDDYLKITDHLKISISTLSDVDLSQAQKCQFVGATMGFSLYMAKLTEILKQWGYIA
jgi:hypothetical protein